MSARRSGDKRTISPGVGDSIVLRMRDDAWEGNGAFLAPFPLRGRLYSGGGNPKGAKKPPNETLTPVPQHSRSRGKMARRNNLKEGMG